MSRTHNRKRFRAHKPFSEMSPAEKIKEARNAIKLLRHPDNRYASAIYPAIARWEATLRGLGVEP